MKWDTLFCKQTACSLHIQVTSKDVPWQVEVAQGVLGRLRPRIFLMFQQYKGGRSSAKCTARLYPRRNPWYSLSEAESTSGHMVLSGVPWKKSPLTPPGIDPGTARLVAQRLNHYAIPGPPIHDARSEKHQVKECCLHLNSQDSNTLILLKREH